jgi:YfiH family protein
MIENDFILRQSNGVFYYSCCAFESLPRIFHGFSTRRGGAPDGAECSLNLGASSWDSAARVQVNRRRFLSALNFETAYLATLHQIHSNRVHIIEDIPSQRNQSDGDALTTRIENVALAIQIADCLPILIADPVNHAVAAVHSGWRGTLSRVLLSTIREMQRAFNSNPARLLVAVGPGIRSCCFEVGPEVAGPFEREYPGISLAKELKDRRGKYLLDLCGALHVQLDLAGVPTPNRYDLDVCTCCNTHEFFSHRAEGPAAGRMMAVIGNRGRSRL